VLAAVSVAAALAAFTPVVVHDASERSAEADGRGVVVRPGLVSITADSPAWMRYAQPWGPSRGSRLIPPGQDSPLGPAFQRDRWDAPAFAASARSCQASCNTVGECDGRETAMSFAAILAGLWRYRRR
jgi:hypothetical protein